MKATALPGASPALVLPVPSGVAKYRCAIFAGPYGPLALSSGAADPSRPDVGTLSALSFKGSGEEFDEEDKERQLFGEAAEGEGSSEGGGAPAVALRSLLLSLPGIEERLGDAAAASPSVHAGEEGTLEIFLRRSEAVVAELMQTVDQHHRRIRREGVDLGRKRRRTGAGGEAAALEGESGGPSRPYCAALLLQLPILERMEGIRSVDLKDGLSRLVVECEDKAGRAHMLEARLPPSFPSACPAFLADLPLGFEPEWTAGGGIALAYSQYRTALAAYGTLWDDLDELDRTAWILEPCLPARRASAERRIAVRPGLSMAVELDPEQPRDPPPTMRLVEAARGAEGERLRERIRLYVEGGVGADSGDEQWDRTISLKANLEVCLGFPLPSPETTERSEYVTECGICYAHRIGAADGDGGEGTIPDAVCGNPSCARSYHESCLFEWLHSLPGARTSFDRVFGTCPYCSESISVRVMAASALGQA